MAAWQITDNTFDFSMTHSIEASQDMVYQVLADMEAYPEFISDLVSVTRTGDLHHFVARAAILTIPATLVVTKTPGYAVNFELVEGPVDSLTGNWLIEGGAGPGLTQVTLTIHAQSSQQSEWLRRMITKFVETKTGKLIAAFDQRVVELQQSGGLPLSRRPATKLTRFMAWLKRLWRRMASQPAAQPTQRAGSIAPVSGASSGKVIRGLFRNEHHLETLEALAATILPPDDFDAGVQDLGFAGVVEMRARYEPGRQEIYAGALEAIDKMAQAKFNKPGFINLTGPERINLLDAVRQGHVDRDIWGQVKPSSFFGALWEDAVFLYCTHPDTWQRIGFPGPSFDTGGYRDFDQAQELLGRRTLA